jgi:hypothetical protein
MSNNKPLDDDDFPVKVERNKLKTKTGEPIATAESEKKAEDVADRLNHDAWRRHEDNWNA